MTGLRYTGSPTKLYAVPVLMQDYVHTDGRSVNEEGMIIALFDAV